MAKSKFNKPMNNVTDAQIKFARNVEAAGIDTFSQAVKALAADDAHVIALYKKHLALRLAPSEQVWDDALAEEAARFPVAVEVVVEVEATPTITPVANEVTTPFEDNQIRHRGIVYTMNTIEDVCKVGLALLTMRYYYLDVDGFLDRVEAIQDRVKTLMYPRYGYTTVQVFENEDEYALFKAVELLENSLQYHARKKALAVQ